MHSNRSHKSKIYQQPINFNSRKFNFHKLTMKLNFQFLIILICVLMECMDINSAWKKTDKSCSSTNNKLLSLLNLLCNTTQTTSIQVRDGCYGCFFRAASVTNGGQTHLVALSQCANLYLANTSYFECARDLALIANGTRPTTAPTLTGCYTGYCDFVRCVRRININALIDECLVENLVGRDISNSANRIFLYTNATSCILARIRCSRYNPISGELQNSYGYGQSNRIFGQLGSSLFSTAINYSNSLQISSNGDLRIISFPSTIQIADLFCSRTTSLEQSIYGRYIC